MESISTAKAALRAQVMVQRDALTLREQRSAAICAQVAGLPLFVTARAMHCYLPMRSEVNTLPLIQQALAEGKRVAVPVVRRGVRDLAHSWLSSQALATLQPGVFGTAQPSQFDPCDPTECDMIVAPLLAFDRAGYRLGYGKGFYDRLLAQVRVPVVGVAFAAQEVASLPRAAWDLPLSLIVTEDELIEGSR